MKINKRLSGILLIVAAIMMLLPPQIFAAWNVDLNRECRLTVIYQDGGTPLSGAKFSLYQVATMNKNGELTVTQEFSRYNININKKGVNWKTLASTLEGYVLRDNITPVCSGTTNSRGLLTFPEKGKKLLPGMYLLVGSRHTQNGKYYDAKPSIVLLPSKDKDSKDLLYDVTISPKHDSHEKKDEKVKRKVLKVWNDAGSENERPKGIYVQLLRNGVVVDTIILSPENNWRYVWENLDDAYVWQVVEADPGKYEVEIVREGITFVITNTRDNPSDTTTETTTETTLPSDPTKPSETTDPDVTTNPSDTTDPDVTTNPSETTNPNKTTGSTTGSNGTTSSTTKPDKPELPLTGQLWWPVPLLISAGLVLIAIGLLRRRGIENEE